MKVQIRYMPMFSIYFSKKNEGIELDKGTIGELIEILINKHGNAEKLRKLIIDEGKLKRGIFLMVGDKQIQDLSFKLNDGDLIILGHIVAGG